MHDKFLTPYKPEETEEKIYQSWLDSGFFNPDTCIEKGICTKDSETFSMVLPPPNVTGILHMGHAAMIAIEDIIIRYERMCGKRTLWIPGTDHAAIATQSKVEKILEKEGTNKQKMGRDAFMERVQQFAQESHDTIVNQIKKMGASIDWSREAFTLDEKRSFAVRTAFVRMYNDGLIYRGHRIVNWDTKGQTTISDDEIVYKEEKTKFYYFTYGPFTIGTSRPETKFGDKYVVMHPDDARYKQYTHGDTFDLEWINGPITATIIKDESIDMEFGTGVMTITPWHSAVDFDIAERHKLDKEQIIDKYGKLLPIAGEFAGVKIAQAREGIVAKLDAKGLLVKVEDNYIHRIATAERTGGIIEPQIMHQWFINVNKEFIIPHSEIPNIVSGSKTTLKEIMRQGVIGRGITILPERFEKTYFQWVDNLRDWCISRQIWYGHRIPVWYHENKCIPISGREADAAKCLDTIVSIDKPICQFCNAEFIQDEDTLDTWFSSGLWTFSTLGWPDKNAKDFVDYHPTNLLETGYDILFFWVARMILMSGYHLGTVPFRTVYLHGLVRDAKGKKMSKSDGNTIDPLEMIEKYGADATRLSVIIGAGPGSDVNLSEDRIRGYRKYTNKIWNIARFVLSNTDNIDLSIKPKLSKREEEILNEFTEVAKYVDTHIKEFKLHLAGEKLYDYTWHTFADVILEESKDALLDSDTNISFPRKWLLRYIFEELLKLQHPFIPYITEEIWGSLPGRERMLMVTKWPVQHL